MNDLTFCNVPEHLVLEANANLCRWPNPHVTWGITDLVPGLSEEQLREAVVWGFDQWKAVCGVTHEEVQTAAAAKVLIGSRRIDGPSGVLAEAELPCGNVRQTRLWFDTGDSWVTGWSPGARQIVIAAVAWHELGHSLGIGHAPQNSPNVMAPVYNPAVRTAGAWDVQQATLRYGPPALQPPTTTPPPKPPPVPPLPPGGSVMEFVRMLTWLLSQPWFLEILRKFTERQALVADEAAMLAAFKEVVNSQ